MLLNLSLPYPAFIFGKTYLSASRIFNCSSLFIIMTEPLFRNPSLKNLPYEKWKDVPEFEGYYQISNYGRVKSLKREIVTGVGILSRLDSILKPTLKRRYNKSAKKYFYSPAINLARDGIKYSFSVPRLVYTVFVEKLDYFDKSFLITFKNEDSLNIYYKNLSKVTTNELAIKIRDSGRNLPTTNIPITQYDVNGKPIAWYESAPQAAKKTGFTARVISNAANGAMHIYKGYFWRPGKNRQRLKVGEIKLNVEKKTFNEELTKRLGLKKIDTKILHLFWIYLLNH
jgi:hypothetical protein